MRMLRLLGLLLETAVAVSFRLFIASLLKIHRHLGASISCSLVPRNIALALPQIAHSSCGPVEKASVNYETHKQTYALLLQIITTLLIFSA